VKPTSAPRVAAHRARKAAAGLAEVRGIWAPPHTHAAVKRFIAHMQRTLGQEQKTPCSVPSPHEP
jgi:hypothetical protein